MKKKQAIFLIIFSAILAGCFSCENDNVEPEKWILSPFAIDEYIISFEIPNLTRASMFYHEPRPAGDGFYNACWTITLLMDEGTDCTRLAPLITLAPGCTIEPASGTVLDFTKQVNWKVTHTDGTEVEYICLAGILP